MHLFKCSLARKTHEISSDDLEAGQVEIVARDEVIKMIHMGLIQSLSSVAAVGLALC